MNEFIPICKTFDVPASGVLCLEIEDRFVVVTRVNGEYFCIDDVCTHDGGTLSDGELADHCLVCPRHGAKFDVRTGDAVSMPATEGTISHTVKVVGDQVLVNLSAD